MAKAPWELNIQNYDKIYLSKNRVRLGYVREMNEKVETYKYFVDVIIYTKKR